MPKNIFDCSGSGDIKKKSSETLKRAHYIFAPCTGNLSIKAEIYMDDEGLGIRELIFILIFRKDLYIKLILYKEFHILILYRKCHTER